MWVARVGDEQAVDEGPGDAGFASAGVADEE